MVARHQIAMFLHEAEEVQLAIGAQKLPRGSIKDGGVGDPAGVAFEDRSDQVELVLPGKRGHLNKAALAEGYGPFLCSLQVVAVEPELGQQ